VYSNEIELWDSTVNYSENVQQINGCRIYQNPHMFPHSNSDNGSCELYIRNLPTDFYENEILQHFDRFGAIYQFRLLMDYDNYNRGYCYLKFYYLKSAALALDVMNYYRPAPGVKLDIQKSYEKCSLYAVNLPILSTEIIQDEFSKLFPDACNIEIKMPATITNNIQNSSCSVLLQFPDHAAALRAKQYGNFVEKLQD
jgi:hypothetical protein